MTSDALIAKLTAYYGPAKKYSDELLEALTRWAENIAEEGRGQVFDWIVENRESMAAVGVKDLKQACVALGIGFRNIAFADPIELVCGACGTAYKFVKATTPYQQLELNQHARCPKCGLPGYDQTLAHAYARNSDGKMPSWWERTVEHFRDHVWSWDGKPGPFFRADIVRREQAETKLERIDRSIAQVAKAKSWDDIGRRP
jgi:hypothetical protein